MPESLGGKSRCFGIVILLPFSASSKAKIASPGLNDYVMTNTSKLQ
jgi:hypothetical protein